MTKTKNFLSEILLPIARRGFTIRDEQMPEFMDGKFNSDGERIIKINSGWSDSSDEVRFSIESPLNRPEWHEEILDTLKENGVQIMHCTLNPPIHRTGCVTTVKVDYTVRF